MDFFFDKEISEDQKKRALRSAKLEDTHGPFGLSKSASDAKKIPKKSTNIPMNSSVLV